MSGLTSTSSREGAALSLELGVAQVRLKLTNLPKLLLRIRRTDRRGDDNILTDLPVNRSSDAFLITGLQGVDDPQNFSGVSARGGGVHHGQADLLIRVDDEDGANGERDLLRLQIVRMDHIIQERDFAIGIGDDWELDCG